MTVIVQILATRHAVPTINTFTAAEVRSSHGGDLILLDENNRVIYTVDARDLRNVLASVRIIS